MGRGILGGRKVRRTGDRWEREEMKRKRKKRWRRENGLGRE